MLTMPIAGRLVDKYPVGRIVPFGIALIIIGMFGLTQVTEDTPYSQLIPMLVVMGMGMGATMMPLFTSALKALPPPSVARGTTLLNITQQIASSVGIATMSVVLTSQLNRSPVIPGTEQIPGLEDGITEADAAILSNTQPEAFAQLDIAPEYVQSGLADAAAAFANTFWVAWVLVVLTLIPALMLPRKQPESRPLATESVPPAVVH